MVRDPLHATLRRQLRRLQLSENEAPSDSFQWRELLFSIDRAYRESDELVYLVTSADGGASDELTQSQHALAVAQRLGGLGTWTYEPESGQVVISEEFAQLLGVEDEHHTMTIEQLLDFVYPVDREATWLLLRNAAASATNRASELRFMTAAGVERWCLCRLASFANGAGRVIRIDGTVLDVSERRAAEENTRRLARTDPLTGLADRSNFFRVLSSALDQSRHTNHRAAVALIDLDGLRSVNERCGRAIGDALADTIARRLRACLRGSDTVARFGDDEFVLLIRDVGSDDHLSQVAARILQACSTSVASGDEPLGVSASVGIALYPADGHDASQLIQSADAARQAAKQAGSHSVHFFGEEVRERRQADRALVASLRTAILRGQISVAYQPIVDGETLRIVGSEALARWSHPTLGPVSPSEFVQLAEQNGLIADLSGHVIQSSCRKLARLPSQLGARSLSINLSLVQLRMPSFVDELQAVLELCRLDPARLNIEIGETALVEDREHAVRTLERLRALGVTVLIDDFTGRAPLGWLRELPVDGIKIDRSLVADIQGSSVGPNLQGVIAIARSLGCELVAEGVETRQQRQALLQAGCRLMQGYLFGLPDSFERWHPTEPAAEADYVP